MPRHPRPDKSMALVTVLVLVLLLQLSMLSSRQGAAVVGVLAKTVSGSVRLPYNKAVAISQFSFVPSAQVAHVEGKFIFTSPAHGKLFMLMDTVWAEIMEDGEVTCRELERKAHAVITIGTRRHFGKGRFREESHKELGMHGLTEWTFTWDIEHRVRTYGWNFFLAECRDRDAPPQGRDMAYSLTFLNPGRSHYPADESGVPAMLLVVWCIMCAYAGFMFLNATTAQGHAVRSGRALALIATAYVLQLLSVFSELVHLWRYAYNGWGWFAFDFLSEIFEGLSQTLLSYILVALACGWSLVEDLDLSAGMGGAASGSDRSGPNGGVRLLANPDALGSRSPATLALAGAVLVTLALQLLNKLVYNDGFSKFHNHETLPGKLLVMLRALLGIVFATTLHRTISRQAGLGGRVERFLRRLQLFGSVWFFSFPLLVFVAGIFAHYLRHRIVTGGVLALQTVSLLMISHQMASSTSSYAQSSTSSSSKGLLGMFSGGDTRSYSSGPQTYSNAAGYSGTAAPPQPQFAHSAPQQPQYQQQTPQPWQSGPLPGSANAFAAGSGAPAGYTPMPSNGTPMGMSSTFQPMRVGAPGSVVQRRGASSGAGPPSSINAPHKKD